MKNSGLIVVFLFLFATALQAQEPRAATRPEAAAPKPGPYLQSFQSLPAPTLSAVRSSSAAVAADRDLTSEKIAIVVVLVVLAIVIYRAVK